VDCDFDGRFNEWFVPSAEGSRDPAGDVLAVDLDGDGEFVDRRPKESEIMPLGRVIRIDGWYYGIELAENGSRIEFRQVELHGAHDASSFVWHAPGRWMFAEQVAGDCEN